MSDIKCPFCGQKLDTGNYYVRCHNQHCNTTVEMEGTEELWQELIRTRKALDIAVDALNTIKGKHDPRCAVYHIDEKTAYDALEKIKGLDNENQ